MRCSQTSPVHPRQSQCASCRLNEPAKYVVVAKRPPGPNSLKDQIFRAVRLHNLVFAYRVAGFDLDGQSLKPVDGLCIRRLNRQVSKLRDELNGDLPQVEWSLAKGGAFTLTDKELPYELLLDMDSFIFETRSLYEIMGKFLVELFRTLFGKAVTEADLQAILLGSDIDTRWIAELRENRKLFFHQTAPWVAVSVDGKEKKFDPVMLKRNVHTFDDPNSFVEFARLREIYDGFVASATELHRFILEQIRLHEEATVTEPA